MSIILFVCSPRPISGKLFIRINGERLYSARRSKDETAKSRFFADQFARSEFFFWCEDSMSKFAYLCNC